MAYLKAYRTGLGGTLKEFELVLDVDNIKDAMDKASEMMAMEVEPFTTPQGFVSVKPYSRVDVFNDNGTYITTAWGE